MDFGKVLHERLLVVVVVACGGSVFSNWESVSMEQDAKGKHINRMQEGSGEGENGMQEKNRE